MSISARRLLKSGHTRPVVPPSASNARAVSEFLDSLGIVGSFNQVDIPNATLLDRLNYLGVKRIRTGTPLGNATDIAASRTRFNMLVAAGYKTLHVLNPTPVDTVSSPISADDRAMIDQRITQLITFLTDNPTIAEAAYGIEYFNELNHGTHGDPDNFDVNIAYGVPKLWTMASTLRSSYGIKIAGPALVSYKMGTPDNDASELKTTFDALNPYSIDRYIDNGNLHSYYGSPKLPDTTFPDKTPGVLQPGWSTQFANTAPTGNSGETMDRYRFLSWFISRAKPFVVTETNSTGAPGQVRNAVMIPRIYLENFRIGVLHTYVFNLLMFNGYGLLDTPANGFAVKQSGVAVHNLTTILADSAPSYTPSGTLNFTVPSGIKRVLLQKSDGSFWLCVWRDVEYDVAATPMTLTFASAKTITIYADLNTTPLASRGPNTTFSVDVGPKVTIIKIT